MKSGNKILICGNGGSAADAQHLSAEFLIRLRPDINRKAYPVISLALDSSTITACGNDYSFDDLFLRNFQALYKKGDILITISTSGNSKNIIKILKYTSSKKIFSIGLLGNKGGKAKKFCSENIIVQSKNVARIQEAHIFWVIIFLNKLKIYFKKIENYRTIKIKFFYNLSQKLMLKKTSPISVGFLFSKIFF